MKQVFDWQWYTPRMSNTYHFTGRATQTTDSKVDMENQTITNYAWLEGSNSCSTEHQWNMFKYHGRISMCLIRSHFFAVASYHQYPSKHTCLLIVHQSNHLGAFAQRNPQENTERFPVLYWLVPDDVSVIQPEYYVFDESLKPSSLAVIFTFLKNRMFQTSVGLSQSQTDTGNNPFHPMFFFLTRSIWVYLDKVPLVSYHNVHFFFTQMTKLCVLGV